MYHQWIVSKMNQTNQNDTLANVGPKGKPIATPSHCS